MPAVMLVDPSSCRQGAILHTRPPAPAPPASPRVLALPPLGTPSLHRLFQPAFSPAETPSPVHCTNQSSFNTSVKWWGHVKSSWVPTHPASDLNSFSKPPRNLLLSFGGLREQSRVGSGEPRLWRQTSSAKSLLSLSLALWTISASCLAFWSLLISVRRR